MIRRTTSEVVLRSHRTNYADRPSTLLDIRSVPRPDLADGEVRVQNLYQQIAAVTADLMCADSALPIPAFRVDEPLYGSAVGRVIESRSDIAVGAVVHHTQGWRDETVVAVDEVLAIPDGMFPAPEYLLNQGVTAYHGMVDVAEVRRGDVVFVSGAAGGVGSVAGQIAKALGAKLVIGTAGGPQKCRYLTDQLGYDVAIDYRSEDVLERLREVAPDGIDVFFDTVAGSQFEAAVQAAAFGARFALCGALSGQIGGGVGGSPRLDVMAAIVREIKILPFTTMHTPEQIYAWNSHYAQWLADGKFVYPHTVLEGPLARTTTALDELLDGKHRGNVIVKLVSR